MPCRKILKCKNPFPNWNPITKVSYFELDIIVSKLVCLRATERAVRQNQLGHCIPVNAECTYFYSCSNNFWVELTHVLNRMDMTSNWFRIGWFCFICSLSRICKRRGTLFILWLSWLAVIVLSPWCLAGCTSM